MSSIDRFLASRIRSLRYRIEGLSRLSEIVNLPAKSDLSSEQWSVIDNQLLTDRERLNRRLALSAREYMNNPNRPNASRLLNARLGGLEFQLSESFTLFDTYMDLITQRSSSELGPLLAGCDVIADDALRRNAPVLCAVERPIVYCDRGFGASILRQGKWLVRSRRAPMSLIQIPYSRLREKHNLTSIVHEVGHSAMYFLGMDSLIPKLFRDALQRAGAPSAISELFVLWAPEIGADFWGFCATGAAQAAGAREVLSLAPRHVFRISLSDPHPPPYLRVLLCMEWCKKAWGYGNGPWVIWRDEWIELYPLRFVPLKRAAVLKKALQYLPVIADCLLSSRIPSLGGMPITSLFNLDELHTDRLRGAIRTIGKGMGDFRKLPPCAQLASFRVIRNDCGMSEERFDTLMSRWLTSLKNDGTWISGRMTDHKSGSTAESSDEIGVGVESSFINCPPLN